MRALVTGSAGFIGRHFVAELESRGCEVVCVDVAAAFGLYDALDVLGHGLLGPAPWTLGRYDLVVHAAAQSPHRVAIDTQPASHIYNQLLDAAMFDWAIRMKPGRPTRFLYFSSCAAADEKPDAYGLLKLTGERMAEQARAAGVPVTVVRPYSGYGEDQSEDFPFRAFVERARRREDPFDIWGDGQQVRDWIHVDDIVAGSLALVEAEVDGPVSLCTGSGVSMRTVAELICRKAGYEPEFRRRLDAPGGAFRRVGDPTEMLKYYSPKVYLAEGIRRALA